MKIHLISRVRNESEMITDTLNYWAGFVTGKMVIYDDVSTDNTRELIRAHPSNPTLIEGKEHHKDRDFSNFYCREKALSIVRSVAGPHDWVVCADADERIEMDWGSLKGLHPKFHRIATRLFDYYITPEDVGLGWNSRTWIGPEYRDIVMIWRHHPAIRFDQPSQRVPTFPTARNITAQIGSCHHYGKARSVQHWEDKCDYYAGHNFSAQPLMLKKWNFRKGKAVKTDYKSDFKNPLIKWKDRNLKGMQLTAEIHKREFK